MKEDKGISSNYLAGYLALPGVMRASSSEFCPIRYV